MKLLVDTSQVQFMVGHEVKPRTDQNKVQRVERDTNIPQWTVQLVAMDTTGSEVINVTLTASQPPKVTPGSFVTPVELQAIPWAQNGRNGVAYRASDLKPVTGSKSASTASAA